MSQLRDFAYEDRALSLIALNSVSAIEASVTGEYGVDRQRLRAAFASLVAEAGAGGRPAEQRLLEYVAGIVERALPGARAIPEVGLSGAATAAVERARTAAHSLAAYRFLAAVRGQFTDEVYRQLRHHLLSGTSYAVEPADLALLFLVALANGSCAQRTDAMMLLARYRHHEGRHRMAGVYYRRAITMAEATGDAELLFNAAGGYGIWLSWVDRFAEAVDALEKAMAATAVAFSAPGAEVATIRIRRALASAYSELGRYGDALDAVDQALNLLATVKAALDQAAEVTVVPVRTEEQLSGEAQKLRMLRIAVHHAIDEHDLAEMEAEVVIAEARRLHQREQLVDATSVSAHAAQERGDLRTAERRYEEAVALAREWGDPGQIAAAYNNLGGFQLDADRPDEAYQSYASAAFYAGQAGRPVRTTALAIVGLGDSLRATGWHEPAMQAYEAGIEVAREGPDFEVMAMLLPRAMADDTWWAEGGSERLSRLVPVLVENSPVKTSALLARAYAYRLEEVGEHDNAVRVLRNAIDVISRRAPGTTELGRLRVAAGRLLAVQRESAAEAHRILAAEIGVLEAKVAEGAFGERKSELVARAIPGYAALIGLLVRHGDALVDVPRPAHRAFELHEAAKSRTLAAYLGLARVQPPDSVPVHLREREAEVLARAHAVIAGGRVGSEAERRRHLREINSDLSDCWRQMRPHAESYVRLRSGEPAGIAELTALIEEQPYRVALATFFCDDENTTCFVLQPGRPLAVTQVPVGVQAWEKAGQELRRLCNGAPEEWPPYPPIRRDRPQRRDFGVLDRMGVDLGVLLEPVGDVDLLCVAPHGPLHVLPFHAARGADGKYLVERFGVVYTPSLTTLQYSLGDHRPLPARPTAFVAGVAADGDLHPEYFEHDEMAFDPAMRVFAHNGPRAATRDRVLTELPRHDIVHLTCHGFFDCTDPLRSGLLVGDGEHRPPRALRQVGVRHRRPFLVTAEDVLAMRLNAHIVTLRACSSGLVGERNAGDEFDGLVRSFIQAGAGAVLAGQWNLDRRSSSQLMSAFYRNWLRAYAPLPKWQALRRAQLDMMASTHEPHLAHPYHWAALYLVGDWR